MKTPAKQPKKLTTRRSNKNADKKSKLTGAQYVEVVKSTTQLSTSVMEYAAETERTTQIKAQCLRDMHNSNNEVELAHLKLAERQAELILERVQLDNERKDNEALHERWIADHCTREQTIEVLREKVKQGSATEQELYLLQQLHKLSNDE